MMHKIKPLTIIKIKIMLIRGQVICNRKEFVMVSFDEYSKIEQIIDEYSIHETRFAFTSSNYRIINIEKKIQYCF
jgi:hypothetical protein